MPDLYPHLRLLRESPVNQRRPGRAIVNIPVPGNVPDFARELSGALRVARDAASQQAGGFDGRRLVKVVFDTPLDPYELKHLDAGIEIVSQESKSIVIAFATEEALDSFESRLATMANGRHVTYANVVYALGTLGYWSPEDRTGWALRQEGGPALTAAWVDVELWPLASPQDRERSWRSFENWLRENEIEKGDAVRQSNLVLYRVLADAGKLERLLNHRDVRTVDLPPRYGLRIEVLSSDLQSFGEVGAPAEGAPGVVVLDTGIASNHPMLGPAVGDSQSFLAGISAADDHGHGTHVAGIALYSDVGTAVANGHFEPALRLFSGRVLGPLNVDETGLIENSIDAAVRYFVRDYGCRVFCLAIGDIRKPYSGGHVRGIAVTLDTLARELGILFVVPTGNFDGDAQGPNNWVDEYPQYLAEPNASMIDPAPALNVLTVGSIARFDATLNSQRYPTDPSERPIARRNQPSPFTRAGPSVGGAVKPELVAYGGNAAVNLRTGNQHIVHRGLGELSTNLQFSAGQLFAEKVGVSFAVPHIAHLAARILEVHPGASANLLRSLLIAHARWPDESRSLMPDDDLLLRLCGYGAVSEDSLFRSSEREVTLIAEDAIPNRHHHFYEVPVPAEYYAGSRRNREVSAALAYSPAVRTTRIGYRSSKMEFRLVTGTDLQSVATMFNAATSPEAYAAIAETGGSTFGPRLRGRGTAQAERWTWRQPTRERREGKLFVVVTRVDQAWGRDTTLSEEPYALAIVVRDRENQEAILYTQIQNQLRARLPARVRV